MTRQSYAVRTLALIESILLGASVAHAQQYTLTPPPFLLIQSTAGAIIPNGCIWTYAAGTSTAIATYADTSGTPNGNPIIADSSGRYVAYLLPGTSYKFRYETTPCSGPSTHGTLIKEQDNIQGVPTAAANVDITGTAGEALTAGQCVYLSDGSGGKNTGQWYKCDSTNPYSSTLPVVGLAVSTVAATTTGTFRTAGSMSGLSSLTAGAQYYVSTSGAITSTAPANNSRRLGMADTTTSLILPNPRTPPEWISDCNGRLTLTTGTPVTTSDVTAATTLFYTPYKGNRCALYDGANWTLRTFAEISIAVPATTSQMYDVWIVDNAGTIALELLAWTNDTTRATALTTQDGVLVKTGATTRRYLGSFRTTTVSGQTEDSRTKRYVWNYYHRDRRQLLRQESNATWNYQTATWRQANGAAANQVDAVIGVAEAALDLTVASLIQQTNVSVIMATSIGEDSTTVPSTNVIGGVGQSYVATTYTPLVGRLSIHPAVGRHFYAWLEISAATGTTTWFGAANTFINGSNQVAAGLTGWIEG